MGLYYCLTHLRYREKFTDRVFDILDKATPYAASTDFTYEYDSLGNVRRRLNAAMGTDETFTYDGQNRLRMHQAVGDPAGQQTIAYDAYGNIAYKSGVGSYAYHSARPHAVEQVYGYGSYQYDANGNMTSRTQDGVQDTFLWTTYNQLKKIVRGTQWMQFDFGANRQRVRQRRGDDREIIYVGSAYEVEINDENIENDTVYIFTPEGRTAHRVLDYQQGKVETRYYHQDALGSIYAITDDLGRVEARYSFDPWGQRTMEFNQNFHDNGPTRRGYTDHEHLDFYNLIHMNGRVYDPVLARFLSADPYVDSATDSQSFNRYSYVSNNPLNSTDPSGYFKLKDALTIVAAVVVGILTAGVALYAYGALIGGTFTGGLMGAIGSVGLAAGWGGGFAIAAGAGFGFGSAFAGALLNGGSIGDAFRAGVIGGLVGGVSAGIANQIGHGIGKDWARTGRAFAHGVSQGVVSEATGEEFRHGFVGAFAASVFGPAIMSAGQGLGVTGRTVAAAIVGGTASTLGGGKFANGATRAAFVHLFNEEADRHFKQTDEHPFVGIVFAEESLFDGEDVAGPDALGKVDSLNRGLRSAGADRRVALVRFKDMADLDRKIALFVTAETDVVTVVAHGLFWDPDDVLTYAKHLYINGVEIGESTVRSHLDRGLASANPRAVGFLTSCDVTGYKGNSTWYNRFLPDVNTSILKAQLGNAGK